MILKFYKFNVRVNPATAIVWVNTFKFKIKQNKTKMSKMIKCMKYLRALITLNGQPCNTKKMDYLIKNTWTVIFKIMIL